MVDPRIYRAGLLLVAVAIIVFAFSLDPFTGGASTPVSPDAAGGTTVLATLQNLNAAYPGARSPGSATDTALAGTVARELRAASGFTVTTRTQPLHTAAGTRDVATVTATRTGLSSGALVVVADRDLAGPVGLSGTAVLIDLAHVLGGEASDRTIELVSTSGSVGAAGTAELADSLRGAPVDAVITLGDLAGGRASRPLLGVFSDGDAVAPPFLRATVARAIDGYANLPAGAPGLGGQLAHLAFPLTLGPQGPFGPVGIPAVLVSTDGDRPDSARDAISAAHLEGLTAAVGESVAALDAAGPVPAPSPYLVIAGKIVPLWAVRLLVLALILPAAVATLDALARTRRRGHTVRRWLVWTLAGALPFALVLAVVRIARATGLLAAVPPYAVGRGAVPLGVAGIGTLVAAGLVFLAAIVLVRPLCIRLAAARLASRRAPETPPGDAAAVAVSVPLTALALGLWVADPFAALLLVPALHLWLWLAQEEVRRQRWLACLLVLLGLVPPALVAAYYIHVFGLSVLGAVWTAVLLLAGGGIGTGLALAWCVALGCLTSACVLALRSAGGSEVTPVLEGLSSVRGPQSYVGPGSLGGTESALRR